MVATSRPRSFVPTTLNAGNFTELEPLYRQLLNRPLETETHAERWLADFSELMSVVGDFGSRRYIAKSCHTDDPEIEKSLPPFRGGDRAEGQAVIFPTPAKTAGKPRC